MARAQQHRARAVVVRTGIRRPVAVECQGAGTPMGLQIVDLGSDEPGVKPRTDQSTCAVLVPLTWTLGWLCHDVVGSKREASARAPRTPERSPSAGGTM